MYEVQDSSLRELCIPEAAVNMVYNNRRQVVKRQRDAGRHRRDNERGTLAGHRMPSEDKATAHKWDAMPLNGAVSDIYNWYNPFQATRGRRWSRRYPQMNATYSRCCGRR